MRLLFGLTLTITAAIILMLPAPVIAAVDLSAMNRLEEVTLFHEGDGARLVIRMREGVTTLPKLSFYEKSVQVDLPMAYAVPAKKEMPLDAPQFSMAGIYQRSPELLRLRFFTKKDGRKLIPVTKLSTDGNLLILTVDTPAPVVTTAPAPVVEETPKPVAKKDPLRSAPIAPPLKATTDWSDAKGSATATATKRPTKQESPLAGLFVRKAEAAQQEAKAAKENGGKTGYLKYEKTEMPGAPDLGAATVKMVVALAVTVGLFLLGAVLFRKLTGKLKLGGPAGNPLVRTLATTSIGPKQRIALVEVAGEVMALGISDESISLLTTIDDTETADRIRRMGAPEPGAGDAAFLASISGALSGGASKKKPAKKGIMARLSRFGGAKKAASPAPALMNEEDLDTFAGKLAAAAGRGEETYTPTVSKQSPAPSREGVEPRPSREELMRRVTGAIRGANATLQSA